MTPPVPLPDSSVFTHEAMNTTFTLRLVGNDQEFLAGLARECFDVLDKLETKLSRFIDGSDVSRINHMQAGETLYLSESCHQCLLLAMQAYVQTGGLFDITLGTRIQHRKAKAGTPPPSLAGRLVIHPDIAAITCEAPGREIDLGGIAKGFALDQMAELLLDWGVSSALLAAGASSLLAIGPQAWPVELAGEHEARQLALTSESLSASGTAMQGNHIVHPNDDEAGGTYLSDRVWAIARTATLAEAWSTALMLMSRDEVADTVVSGNSLLHAYADLGGRVEELP
ncbi:MAG: FAD:protein FMN transferase [Verrucomicrobiota bacterium]